MKKVKSISIINIPYLFWFVKPFLKKILKICIKNNFKSDKVIHLVTLNPIPMGFGLIFIESIFYNDFFNINVIFWTDNVTNLWQGEKV